MTYVITQPCITVKDASCVAVCPVECCLPDPNHKEDEKLLLERAIKLHPEDAELQKRASANDYPSRFRK